MSTRANEFQAFEYFIKYRKRGAGTRAIPVAPYTPKEVGTLLGFSAATIRGMISDDPGVIRVVGPGGRVTSKIPEEVVLRLRQRLTQKPLKPQLALRNPRSIVLLRDRS
jgi:hypothetical protein